MNSSIALTGRRFRKISHWFELRDVRYIYLRFVALMRRYGVSASRAKKRVFDCVDRLALHGCHPTFPTPGQVVARNGTFCRELQRRGAELAVHGYHHLDFRALSPDESRRQFAVAASAYRRNGIQFGGFRCPYLSYTPQLNDSLPSGDFQYSSNRAIWWDVIEPRSNGETGNANAVFEGLSRFYRAESSQTHVSVPRMSDHLIEIPVCLPDDLQLLDGLKLDERGVRQAWANILQQTHRRGELFDLMFHPESFEHCGPAVEAVLREARDLEPRVWITQLRDVNQWWREKARFTVERADSGHGVHLTFHCSDRATILARHVKIGEPTEDWCGSYRVVRARKVQLNSGEMPFIGVPADTPSTLVSFLQEQGYILETGAEASRCALYLSSQKLAALQNDFELIDFIETSCAPLIRFWRWPSETRSAFCVTGDLDALSLTDYVARVLAL